MKNKNEEIKMPRERESWIAGYIVAGLIFGASKSLQNTLAGEYVALVVAILAGVFYHKLKSRIKIKNEVGRIIATFFVLEIISAVLMGILLLIFR